MLLVWVSLPVMACAIVTELCMLLVCLQTDLCGIRGTEGNDLQPGDCLEFTLLCVGQAQLCRATRGSEGRREWK